MNHFVRCLRVLMIASAAVLFALPASVHAAGDLDRPITLQADNTSIPALLRILAEKGGLNIVTGPGVTEARISISIRDVPVDQAVNLVVRAAGLAYERIGNSILVASPEALKQESGLSTYIVELKFAGADEVREALQDLCKEIQIDKSGNRLIVKTSPRVISEINEVVRIMDVPAQQVMLEARIIEVSTDDLKTLGIDWDKLNRQTAVIVEGPIPGSTPPDVGPANLGYQKIGEQIKYGPWNRQNDMFQIALDLLVRDGRARVLATPRIATLNGKEASMLIGRRIPYVVTGTVFAGGAAAPTQRVEKEEVGVKLRITPLINADGYITTTISPEVSSVTGFVGQNNDLPIVSTRQATTTVRLKDGDSVIIGGLLQEDETKNVTRIPILGDIPGLGLLFQHHNYTLTKRDLVIEVTPRILPEKK
ncbi:MAG: hypothetical protein HOP12_00500 [Candidatus Eisenbacteria bacterium]|uniref:Secretin/TonB short N-terminal domain-containing protein n=1 Tax=Eiseniibacteriota bacterium TaxID=2212470 RepID=A0A849SDS3_UNCEI|nr:hypothetical protein [Candidatus Eisenbacteria bacterium]